MKLNKSIICGLFLFIGIGGYSQTNSVAYFKDARATKTASQSNARYKKTITNYPNGNVTTEIEKIKDGTVVHSETYRGSEPYGVWILNDRGNNLKLDYDFDMVYQDECNCETQKETAPDSTNKLILNDIRNIVANNLNYPERAAEEGIQGNVRASFKINNDGALVYYSITKSVNILLDKEAIRVLRLLNHSTVDLSKINGGNNCFCFPIKFKLM